METTRHSPGGRVGAHVADRLIEELASAHRGTVSRAELRALGISDDEIDGRIGSLLLPELRGVFLVGHRARAHGAGQHAALKAIPSAALAGRSSSGWLALVPYAGPVELITASRSGRSRPGIVLHRCATLREEDVHIVDGLRCTTPARTACDVAAWHPQLLRKLLNEAERRLVHMGDLRAQIAGRPGARAMRDALDHLDPRLADTRSPPEDVLADALLRRRPRIPVPHANVLVGGFLVDFWWPEHRLVVQVDGGQDHLRPSVFDRDRRMDNELPDAGVRVLRYPAARIERELGVVVDEVVRAIGDRNPT